MTSVQVWKIMSSWQQWLFFSGMVSFKNAETLPHLEASWQLSTRQLGVDRERDCIYNYASLTNRIMAPFCTYCGPWTDTVPNPLLPVATTSTAQLTWYGQYMALGPIKDVLTNPLTVLPSTDILPLFSSSSHGEMKWLRSAFGGELKQKWSYNKT